MSVIQGGARLVVSELSRLGRSLGQIVAVLDALAKAGVAFAALKENIQVEGKSNIQTKVVTTLFALFAEVERDLIWSKQPVDQDGGVVPPGPSTEQLLLPLRFVPVKMREHGLREVLSAGAPRRRRQTDTHEDHDPRPKQSDHQHHAGKKTVLRYGHGAGFREEHGAQLP